MDLQEALRGRLRQADGDARELVRGIGYRAFSNDEVIDGKSEQGGYPVVKKNMKQWVIDQPAFAEKLLEGLNEIDWPESTKEIQRNWIGKSTGVEVDFQLVGGGQFSIYTTCIEKPFTALPSWSWLPTARPFRT